MSVKMVDPSIRSKRVLLKPSGLIFFCRTLHMTSKEDIRLIKIKLPKNSIFKISKNFVIVILGFII